MIRKGLAVAVILLFIGMCVVPSTAVQELREVSSVCFDGNTLYVGGSGANNYTRIQDAIDDAVDGDTVYVYNDSSPYIECIDIDKRINLIGENKETTVIDGNNGGRTIDINSCNVSVSGFTIKNGDIGISISNPPSHNYNNNTIYNNIICDNIIFGLYVGTSYNSIINNIIISNGIEIDLANGDIFLEHAHNNIISGNTIDSILEGIEGIFLRFSDNNLISNNTISTSLDVTNWGIRLEECKDNVISSNIIQNVREGINIYYSSKNNVVNLNSFSNTTTAISLSFTNKNEIISNNFYNNGKNAFFHFFALNNHWDGNYWDEPRDSPYIIRGRLFLLIPWFNFDWNPAQEPNDIGV